MPSVSAKQHRFMEGIAHGMKPRSGKGPSKKVAMEFVNADKGKKFPGPPKPGQVGVRPAGLDAPKAAAVEILSARPKKSRRP